MPTKLKNLLIAYAFILGTNIMLLIHSPKAMIYDYVSEYAVATFQIVAGIALIVVSLRYKPFTQLAKWLEDSRK